MNKLISIPLLTTRRPSKVGGVPLFLNSFILAVALVKSPALRNGATWPIAPGVPALYAKSTSASNWFWVSYGKLLDHGVFSCGYNRKKDHGELTVAVTC